MNISGIDYFNFSGTMTISGQYGEGNVFKQLRLSFEWKELNYDWNYKTNEYDNYTDEYSSNIVLQNLPCAIYPAYGSDFMQIIIEVKNPADMKKYLVSVSQTMKLPRGNYDEEKDEYYLKNLVFKSIDWDRNAGKDIDFSIGFSTRASD